MKSTITAPPARRFSPCSLAPLAACLCLLLLTWLSASVWAANGQADEYFLRGERPNANGGPTEIHVAVVVLDIERIDDVNQRFTVDMFVVSRWKDPRLALPEPERKGRVRFLPSDELWTPTATILNQRSLTRQLRDGVEVDDLGNVIRQNRFIGELAADLTFQEFPFDVQRLLIDIVSYENTTDELQFIPAPNAVSHTGTFSIEGWYLKQLEPEVGVLNAPASGRALPRLTLAFEARRDSNYYLLSMLLPMALIVFMAWTVFWLQPTLVPPRIAISTASIFSLIALGVSIRLGLPKISYLTRADVFVLGCTMMVFLALGMAVLGSRWANSDREGMAVRMNSIARWVYLLLFAVIALAAVKLF